MSDFDDTDFDLFTEYDKFVNKFCMYQYDLSSTAYTAISYGNLNSAYLGFDYNYDQLLVNSYDP